MVNGDVSGLTEWRYTGDGAAIVLPAESSMQLTSVSVAATSGIAFAISGRATLTLISVHLVSSLASQNVACDSLATGVGSGSFPCDDSHGGRLTVMGPIYIATSGVGFAMGDTKFIGEDASAFEIALSSREPGQYALHMAKDAVHSTPITVGPAMDVTIAGEPSLPSWTYRDGPDTYQFTVQQHGHLQLLYLSLLPYGDHQPPKLWVAGGRLSIVHCYLQTINIGGTGGSGHVAITASEAVSLRLDTMDPRSSVTFDSVVLNQAANMQAGCNGPAPCSSDMLRLHGLTVTIRGSRFNHVQLAGNCVSSMSTVYCANITVTDTIF